MGELLNRALQREILSLVAHAYPASMELDDKFNEVTDNSVKVNVAYLQEHGLLTANWTPGTEQENDYPVDAKITARGLDFLADDGGLGAILGVVVVRLHDDTIQELLIKKVAQSDGDETAKASLIKSIRELPAEAVSTVAKRLLERGLDQLPSVFGEILKVVVI